MNSVGISRFVYSKQQAEVVYKYLQANRDDIVKAFSCVWNDNLFGEQPPPMILELVERINILTKVEGTNFDRIWDAMIREAETTLEVCRA